MYNTLTRLHAWERWQAAAGDAWRGWATCPALVTPDFDDIGGPLSHVQSDESASLVNELRPALAGRGTALVVDLEPVLGVQIAARINEMELAHAVLVLPRWPYDEAVLETHQLVNVLIEESDRLRPAENPSSSVVFVLDAQRSCGLSKRPLKDRRADNRYALTAADLPNLTRLRERGVHNVIKLARR